MIFREVRLENMAHKTDIEASEHAANPYAPPIFILGARGRSGTHFLYDLLCLHPDCTHNSISEDYLMTHVDLLIQYADEIYKNWPREWRVQISPRDTLYRCLGEGLISFLHMNVPTSQREFNKIISESANLKPPSDLPGKRLVTKSPYVDKNLNYFFKIFPRAHLLIVIRDGRSVVESLVKSFDCSYEVEFHRWADSIKIILEFEEQVRGGDHKYLIVKYEELFTDTESEIRRIFAFLGLDEDSYDYDRANNLPVRGSSELRAQGKKMHWRPVEKVPDFNPLNRWNHWDRSLHERFNWIAGDYLEKVGYKKQEYSSNRTAWNSRHHMKDVVWRFMSWLKIKQDRDKLNRAENFRKLKL